MVIDKPISHARYIINKRIQISVQNALFDSTTKLKDYFTDIMRESYKTKKPNKYGKWGEGDITIYRHPKFGVVALFKRRKKRLYYSSPVFYEPVKEHWGVLIEYFGNGIIEDPLDLMLQAFKIPYNGTIGFISIEDIHYFKQAISS